AVEACRREIEYLIADGHAAARWRVPSCAPKYAARKILDRKVGGRVVRRLHPGAQLRCVGFVEPVVGHDQERKARPRSSSTGSRNEHEPNDDATRSRAALISSARSSWSRQEMVSRATVI